jgi:hypothetical protein
MLIPAANRTTPIGNPRMDNISAEPSMARGIPNNTPTIEILSLFTFTRLLVYTSE